MVTQQIKKTKLKTFQPEHLHHDQSEVTPLSQTRHLVDRSAILGRVYGLLRTKFIGERLLLNREKTVRIVSSTIRPLRLKKTSRVAKIREEIINN